MVAHAKLLSLACLAVTAALLACSSGDSGPAGGGDYSPTWIYISSANLVTLTDAPSVELRGHAYCDACPPSETAFSYCPTIAAPATSNVAVTWRNDTTGASGDTLHMIAGSCSCLFSYCTVSYSHAWVAYYLPLELGENRLTVTASFAGSASSDSVVVTRVPLPVTGLSATAGSGQVVLQWDRIAEATAYNLYWSTDPYFTRTTANLVAAVDTPFVHDGLYDDVTYYYMVTALSGAQESALSEKVFATPGWHSSVLAATTTTTERSEAALAVDAGQHLHVQFAYDECTQYSTLPNGFESCVAKNYFNYYLTDLSGSPVSEALPSSSDVDANLALGADATVHIAYVDAPFVGVVHGRRDAGSWSIETIDAAGWCDAALAVDAAGRLHLAYNAAAPAANDLRYATDAGGSWLTATFASFTQDAGCDGQATGTLAVTAAADGTPTVVYAGKSPDYGLIVATRSGGTWLHASIDSGYVTDLAAAIDANGRVHIAYVDNTYLRYAHQDGSGGWAVETVADERAIGQPGIAVAADGSVHFAYIGNGDHVVKYARQIDGAWRILALNDRGASGADIAVGPLGKVHIVYFAGAELRYVSNR